LEIPEAKKPTVNQLIFHHEEIFMWCDFSIKSFDILSAFQSNSVFFNDCEESDQLVAIFNIAKK